MCFFINSELRGDGQVQVWTIHIRSRGSNVSSTVGARGRKEGRGSAMVDGCERITIDEEERGYAMVKLFFFFFLFFCFFFFFGENFFDKM